MNPLCEVSELVVRRVSDEVAVVDGVSLTVCPGEVLGMVGASGSGKTTTALALLGHLRPGLRRTAGRVRVAGADPFDPRRVVDLRRRVVSFLGQDPAAALNPARRVGAQVGEAVRARAGLTDRAAVLAEVVRSLERVGLPTRREFLRRYPHQVSGGQARRIAFAIATAGSPALLVLDEPTAGLDRAVAAEVRSLIADRPPGHSTVLISHDPQTIDAVADRVLAFDRGRVVSRPPARVMEAREAVGQAGREILVVEGLCADHDGVPALVDVGLRVRAGGCVAVVGPSGSGKSTLARCLVGLHERSAGDVRLAGRSLAESVTDRRPAHRAAVQLVAQDSAGALNPRETVLNAITRPLRSLRGLDPQRAEAEALALLDQVRLPSVISARLPGALSGGERQRVNLARALACAPKLLVCDEITSALDDDIGGAVLDLVADLRREHGLGVVLVTHNLAEVTRYADTAVLLDAGRVSAVGPVAELFAATSGIRHVVPPSMEPPGRPQRSVS